MARWDRKREREWLRRLMTKSKWLYRRNSRASLTRLALELKFFWLAHKLREQANKNDDDDEL